MGIITVFLFAILMCSGCDSKSTDEIVRADMIVETNEEMDQIEQTVFYMIDADEEVVVTVNVNTDEIKLVPHNGACTYNFVINELKCLYCN